MERNKENKELEDTLKECGWGEYKPCTHPEHNFPNMMYIPPGEKRTHKCPRCGFVSVASGSSCRW